MNTLKLNPETAKKAPEATSFRQALAQQSIGLLAAGGYLSPRQAQALLATNPSTQENAAAVSDGRLASQQSRQAFTSSVSVCCA